MPIPQCVVESVTYNASAGGNLVDCVHCKYGSEGLNALPLPLQQRVWDGAKLCTCSDPMMVDASGAPRKWTNVTLLPPLDAREGWSLVADGSAPSPQALASQQALALQQAPSQPSHCQPHTSGAPLRLQLFGGVMACKCASSPGDAGSLSQMLRRHEQPPSDASKAQPA